MCKNELRFSKFSQNLQENTKDGAYAYAKSESQKSKKKKKKKKKKNMNMFIVNNSHLTPFNSLSCFNFDYLIACLLTLNEGFLNAKECVKEIFRQWNVVFKKLDGYFQ